MKKLLAAALSAVMALSAGSLKAFAADKAAETGGDLTAIVRLNHPELQDNNTNRKIIFTLYEEQSGKSEEIKSFSLADRANIEKTAVVDGKKVPVTVTPLNEQNEATTTENTVGYYEVAFHGLPRGKNYTISLSAPGYAAYQSQPIELKNYSRKILIGAWEGGFALGDTNNDNKIDAADLIAIRQNLGKSEDVTDEANPDEILDLTRDKIVDIEDLAFVHANQGKKGDAVLFDTAVIIPAVADINAIAEELNKAGITVEGGIENLFIPNGKTVTLKPKKMKDLKLSISFNNPVETEGIEITVPQAPGAVEAGEVLVEYEEDGKNKTEKFSFAAPDLPQGVYAIGRSDENSLVINLGKRVAVKKVTISVTKTQDDTNFAIVESIQFLKNITPDNTEITNSVPTNIKAAVGSGEVSLSWKAVNNIDGYIVRWSEEGKGTKEVRVTKPEVTIKGLENLKTYYFTVSAYTEDGWEGKASARISAMPQPNAAPPAPDYLTVEPQDRALTVSWKKTENALSYNIYCKKTTESERAYKKVTKDVTSTSAAIGSLENGISYDIYVTAVNNVGEGPHSLVAQGTPEKQVVEAPDLPTSDRIPNSAITNIKMTDPTNVDKSQYPNGFDVNFVSDGDYSTHWTAKTYAKSKQFIFEFDEEQSMNYLIYVPRLDGNYRDSIDKYAITAWDKDGNKYDLTRNSDTFGNPNGYYPGPYINKINLKEDGYVILPFQRNDHIKKIGVEVRQYNGSPTGVSLSEIAFYTYNGIEDEIDALFANSSKTELKKSTTLENITALEERLEQTSDYYLDKDMLKDELYLAKELLNGNTQALGHVKDGVFSISAKNDVSGFSSFQPLGISAKAEETITIYADIPQGQTLSLIPTQYFSEVKGWSGSAISITNGRNIIKIPALTTLSTEKGGSLYLQYSGNKGDEIKLQVRGKGAYPIPTLELYNWENLNETQRKTKIEDYVRKVTAYAAGLSENGIQTNIRNATEISLPGVLLSLPADTVARSLAGGNSPEDKLYQNVLAWEQLMELMYRTHGVDNYSEQQSRNNIRYHRMFSGAFMYAAGSHIGVGYGSTAALVQGRPANPQTNDPGALFGWGIAHEIGHNMDTLGHAEITNNIYSLFAQTFDGIANTGKSRLENSNKYPMVFDKTSSGAKGLSNDVFTQLAMYWQLHLAYDDAGDNFYNKVNKLYREGAGSGFGGDEKFAVVASKAANRNLTEFFTQWGVEISDGAKSEMSKYSEETRKIHYLSDESRRKRLNGSKPASGTVSIDTSINIKDVTVNISANISGDLQGYEILRNGRPYAFVPANEKAVFTETVHSSNNKAITYQVKAIDILGNVVAESPENEIRIEHNNEINRSLWSFTREENGDFVISFDGETDVAGIVFKNMPKKETISVAETSLRTISLSTEIQNSNNDDNDSTESGENEEDSSQLNDNNETNDPSSEVESSSQTDDENTSGGESSAETGDNSSEVDESDETSDDLDKTEVDETNGEGEATPAESAPISKAVIQVREKGKDFITALTIDLEEIDLTKPENALQLFNGGAENGRVLICENVEEIRISGLPASVTEANFDFAGYPGDSIGFMEGAIGRLAHDYRYGEGDENVISAGTLIITGVFRGDPVYNTVRILGEFAAGSPTDEEARTEERPINGEAIMFAQVTEGESLSEINNGIWIFVPNVQAEKELQKDICNNSVLPGRIKAELYRTDDPNNAESKRLTSDTKWISSPTEQTMPAITLKGE